MSCVLKAKEDTQFNIIADYNKFCQSLLFAMSKATVDCITVQQTTVTLYRNFGSMSAHRMVQQFLGGKMAKQQQQQQKMKENMFLL